VPEANIRQERLRFYIKKGRFPSPLELSPLSQEGNWIYGQRDRIFHFERFDREREQFLHFWVLDLNPMDLTLTRRIEAARATWDQGYSTWRLEQVRMWLFEKERLVQSEQHDVLYLPLAETPAYFKKDIKKPAYMSVSELATHISELERSGIDVHEFRVALQRKIASPITCLVMTLVGVPFGFTLGRKGALYGIGLGIFLGMVYWLSLGFFEELGKYGYVGSGLAGWGPGILFGTLGVFALFRVRT
jgi:lipopolysaccharide export LptBFGC system permease protein LptF